VCQPLVDHAFDEEGESGNEDVGPVSRNLGIGCVRGLAGQLVTSARQGTACRDSVGSAERDALGTANRDIPGTANRDGLRTPYRDTVGTANRDSDREPLSPSWWGTGTACRPWASSWTTTGDQEETDREPREDLDA